MSYTVGSIETDISEYLSNRTLVPSKAWEWTRKAVLELSRDYDFPLLQATGPTVPLTTGQAQYAPSYFMQPADNGLDISRIRSFYMYYTYPYVPVSVSNGAAPGINLTATTMQDIELMLNITGQPVKYCRFNNQIFIGFVPYQPFSCYMRYQKEHPFPNAKTDNAGADPILLDNEWEDIVGYASALRGAISLRLLDYASQFRTILYGDPKFQLSGGTEGEPGLIFRRVSQRERDAESATKRVQLVVTGR